MHRNFNAVTVQTFFGSNGGLALQNFAEVPRRYASQEAMKQEKAKAQ